jgi:hypothetical protein
MIAPTRTTDRSASEAVRAGVTAADRLRRTREATRRVWRAAPVVAAAGLCLSAGSRWAGWPALIPLGALFFGVAGLIAYAFAGRRDRGVSDAIAARIDEHAGLRGELRSATWFAARDLRDPWVDFHLNRAAARLHTIDWARLYPVVRAPRARLATAAMAIAGLALLVTLPEPVGFRVEGSSGRRAREAGAPAGRTGLLSPELQKQLEKLLAAAENGSSSPAQRAISATELRALLAQLSQLKDREAVKELARALDRGGNGPTNQTEPDVKALAERTKRTAELTSLSPEVRQTLEELSENLLDAARSENASPKDPGEAIASTEENQPGDAARTTGGADVDDSSIQSVKDAGAGGGVGVLMMSSEEAAMGGEPGAGAGGGSAPDTGRGQMAAIAQALRKETVEAATDNAGDNVLTETRRKTQHGQAAATFTRSAARTFDSGRVATPPAVPESRRQEVRTYFIRKQ